MTREIFQSAPFWRFGKQLVDIEINKIDNWQADRVKSDLKAALEPSIKAKKNVVKNTMLIFNIILYLQFSSTE